MNAVSTLSLPMPMPARPLLARLTGLAIIGAARLLTGVRAYWHAQTKPAEPAPSKKRLAATPPTVYFANHSSHADFVLLWASLPPAMRRLTRPVAAADYWRCSALRRFIGQQVFGALLIDRDGPLLSRGARGSEANPVQQMLGALRAGQSLILFPEGTRNTGDEALLPFKSGLFHLARACAQAGQPVRLVPVWIDNLKRVLPKGMLVPLPLACSVGFGAPLAWGADEDRVAFARRAEQAVLALRPASDGASRDSTNGAGHDRAGGDAPGQPVAADGVLA